MAMVSSTEGWSTKTCWKRRSSAGSFSMLVRYSSRVVAPIMRSSPRASIGLIMLPASMAPSALPAPTMVWSSSMKVTTSPSASVISLSTALSRSSNSPRYLAPATIEPRSRLMRRLCLSDSGTSPSTMRRARPSTMAVLPTPGSPMSTGLFLVRRDSTWMMRRISSSRPMTGSMRPRRASSVRSRPYFSRAWNWSSGVWEVTRWLPRTDWRAVSSSSRSSAQVGGEGEQEVLGGEVLVAQVGPGPVGHVHGGLEVPAQAGLAAVGPGQLVHGLVGRVAQRHHVGADLGQHGQDDAVVLAQQGGQQVVGGDLGVAVRLGRLDGRGERLLGLAGPAVRIERHGARLPARKNPDNGHVKVRAGQRTGPDPLPPRRDIPGRFAWVDAVPPPGDRGRTIHRRRRQAL
jgi:hypothetical protein